MSKTNRPRLSTAGSVVTTPKAEAMIGLLGPGVVHGPVALTCDETRALNKLYGFVPEEHELLQAGADRNMVRHAESDGLRLVAWLARFVPEGEDPLKTLVQLATDAGFDVSADDIEWSEE